jgi:hypothetical protein
MRGLPHPRAPRALRRAVAITLLSLTAAGSLSAGCGGSGGSLDQGTQDASLVDLGADQSAPSDQGTLPDQGLADLATADLGDLADQGHSVDQGTVVDQGGLTPDVGTPDLGPPCGPDNCAGCCDSFGECRTGTTFSFCGLSGVACDGCSWPETCEATGCEPRACSATAPTRGVNGSDTCASAGAEFICSCPDNQAGCTGTGTCVSQYATRFRFRVATAHFDETVTYDPGPPGPDTTIAPDPVVELQFGNTPALTTTLVAGAFHHEYVPPVGVLRGVTGLPLLRVTLYDADYPGLSQRLHCNFSLDEASDVRARRLVCQEGATYVELFVEPQ